MADVPSDRTKLAASNHPDPANPWFRVEVALDQHQIPNDTPYATLIFNATPSFGRPGGEVAGITGTVQCGPPG